MSEWTVDTLKEYMESLFASRSEATEIAMTAAQRAVDKAERLADLRAESQDRMAREQANRQNEWRATINDVIAERLTRHEYEVAHGTLLEKVDALAARVDRHDARGAGTSSTVLWLFAGLGAVVGLGGFIFGLIEMLTR